MAVVKMVMVVTVMTVMMVVIAAVMFGLVMLLGTRRHEALQPRI